MNTQVPVYYLNADFDYRQLLEVGAADIDCLHTVQETREFPEEVFKNERLFTFANQVTICLRVQHHTYVTPYHDFFAYGFTVGTLNSVL